MVAAKKSTVLVTCDNGAMLQIFDLSAIGMMEIESMEEMDLKQSVERVNVWCTGHDNITSVDYLEERDLILTAGHDGEIVLWTDNGVKIGMFGQVTYSKIGKDPVPRPWNLNDPKTFVDQESRSELDSVSDDPEIAKKDRRGTDRESRRAVHGVVGGDGMNGGDGQDKENEVLKISEDTLRLLQPNNTADLDGNEATDTLLSSPELHAILQKPAHSLGRSKKRSNLRKLVTRQLKTFELDDIPKESPFK